MEFTMETGFRRAVKGFWEFMLISDHKAGCLGVRLEIGSVLTVTSCLNSAWDTGFYGTGFVAEGRPRISSAHGRQIEEIVMNNRMHTHMI